MTNVPPPGAAAFEDAASAAPPPDPRPVVSWIEGDLPNIVDEAEQHLIASESRIYQRGSMLVRIVRRESTSVRHYKRTVPGTLALVPLEKAYLQELLTREIHWQRFDKRNNQWRVCNCPEQVAVHYLARDGDWKLPALRAAISAPTLRPDGSVLQDPGYDPATHTYYDTCGVDFPRIPDRPTKDQAFEALQELLFELQTFPFEDDVDKSVALALAMTGLVRRSLPSAPMGAITAPTMASGKTLLANIISILATGADPPAMTYPETEEEAGKVALAVLMGGDAVVLLDNVERPLSGAWLCSVLTEETYSGRLLGRNEQVKVPTATLWLATGNQLVVAGDLRTRTLMCRLDPRVEKPEERIFDGDLREQIVTKRPRLVAAALTVMRAWQVSGQRVEMKPWGRFERWSHWVRAPLVWLGQVDPCKSLAVLERDDPVRSDLVQVMLAWWGAFGDAPGTVAEAIKATGNTASAIDGEAASALKEALENIAGDRAGNINRKRLGHWLARHEGRIVENKRFVRHAPKNGSVVWSLEAVRP